MAAKMSRFLKNCLSFSPLCSSTLTFMGRNFNNRLPASIVAVRNVSSLCVTQRSDHKLSTKNHVQSAWQSTPVRHLATDSSMTEDSEISEITEDDNDDVPKVYKKLTLDDIVSKWPENKPAWVGYRRNHKGQIPPKRTRLRCTTVTKQLLTQNPCPVCKIRVANDYEIESKDVVFLSQFMSPHTGHILDTRKTGVCRQQQKKLVHAIETAKYQGYLPFTIPGPRDPPKPFKPAGIPAPNIRNKTG